MKPRVLGGKRIRHTFSMESMADLTKRLYIFSEKASVSLSDLRRFSSGRFSARILRFRLKGSCTDIIISKEK